MLAPKKYEKWRKAMIKSFFTGLPSVSQSAVLGILLNVYVNNMQNEIEGPTQLVQYAKTFCLCFSQII